MHRCGNYTPYIWCLSSKINDLGCFYGGIMRFYAKKEHRRTVPLCLSPFSLLMQIQYCVVAAVADEVLEGGGVVCCGGEGWVH